MCLVFTHSEVGGHRVNQDAFEVRPHPAATDVWLCALADGQGGQAGGAEAAQRACQVVIGQTAALSLDQLQDYTCWVTALQRADEAVRADPSAGFTTLIGFLAHRSGFVGACNGDSALWLVDAGAAVRDVTKHQYKNPPVGSGEAAIIPFAGNVRQPWLLLAMTDGVWKYVGHDRLRTFCAALRGAELLEALRAAACLPGSGQFQDDFTAVILQSSDGQAALPGA